MRKKQEIFSESGIMLKRICEQIKVRCVPKEYHDAGMWGHKIITERASCIKT